MGDYFGSVALPSMKERQRKLCQIKLKPRAEPVYNDSNNIGVRMLEKLGWSEGKGLGKREDGMSTPILPKTKQDSEGFGYAGEKDNHWAQHDQDFNQLLKSLNGGEEGTAEDELEVAKIESLEQKSKNSRARVHYKKFTRGKDLSRASDKDLANIFGKRTLEEVKNPAVVTEIKEQKPIEEIDGEPQETNILGLTTIKATMSVQDYFKSKMQEKLGNVNGKSAEDVLVEETSQKKKSKTRKNKDNKEQLIPEPVLEVQQVEMETEAAPKMKKKKKRSNDENLLETVGDDTIVNEVVEEDVLPREEPPKKKSKKEKRKLVIAEIEGDVVANAYISKEVIEEESSQLNEIPKKKSKKEKQKQKTVEHEMAPEIVDDTTNIVLEVSPTEESPKRKSKKEKRKNSIVEHVLESEVISNVDQEENSVQEEPVDKKTKKKKSKKSSSDEPEGTLATAEEVQSPSQAETIIKKKKKQSKDEPEKHASKEAAQTEAPGGDGDDDEITCRVKVSVLKQLDEHGFPGANFGDIVGYGLTQDVILVKREGNRKPSLEKHRFIQQKQTSFQRRRQMLKKVSAFKGI